MNSYHKGYHYIILYHSRGQSNALKMLLFDYIPLTMYLCPPLKRATCIKALKLNLNNPKPGSSYGTKTQAGGPAELDYTPSAANSGQRKFLRYQSIILKPYILY